MWNKARLRDRQRFVARVPIILQAEVEDDRFFAFRADFVG
jgi:hypothetical protein